VEQRRCPFNMLKTEKAKPAWYILRIEAASVKSQRLERSTMVPKSPAHAIRTGFWRTYRKVSLANAADDVQLLGSICAQTDRRCACYQAEFELGARFSIPYSLFADVEGDVWRSCGTTVYSIDSSRCREPIAHTPCCGVIQGEPWATNLEHTKHLSLVKKFAQKRVGGALRRLPHSLLWSI
jgi:hypothetical protein